MKFSKEICGVGKSKILQRQTEKDLVEFAVAVFVMKDGEGITPGLEPPEHSDGAVSGYGNADSPQAAGLVRKGIGIVIKAEMHEAEWCHTRDAPLR